MKTRVFLIRHGATELANEDRFAGTTDVSLSAVGREQARRLSRRLAHAGVAAAYSSPLGRAIETAAILAEPHGLPVVAHPTMPREAWRSLSSRAGTSRSGGMPRDSRRCDTRIAIMRWGDEVFGYRVGCPTADLGSGDRDSTGSGR
jgi:bisphosphoglycerate-dependent phosphoglycerate mutase